MNVTRRDLLKVSGGAALWAAGPMFARAAEVKKIPIGVQLYSVRQACQRDLPGALRAIAEMGYKGVEFAGYYGKTAKELRTLLDDNGLTCCGTHTGLGTLQAEALKPTVEFNEGLGNKYLVVPGLPHESTKDRESTKRTADWFTETAEKVKPSGMHVGYHAHGGDFRKVDGDRTLWEVLFSQCGDDVMMQLDTGNCLGGGGNPYDMLAKFPGRSLTVHMKPHGGKDIIGEDSVEWPRVFELCESVGGTEWYIVEQETAPGSFDNIRACLVNMRKMGK